MRRRPVGLLVVVLGVAAGASGPATAASSWTVGLGTAAAQGRARSTPAAPTGVTATCNGLGSVLVAWTASTGATSYSVEYSTTGSASGYGAGAAVGASPYTFTVGSVSVTTTYWFRVQALTGTWSGPYANANHSRTINLSLVCS